VGLIDRLLDALAGPALPASDSDAPHQPPIGRFLWKAPLGGAVSYHLRQAVQAKLGPSVSTGADFVAPFLDLDLVVEGGSLWRGSTLYVDPPRDWTEYHLPSTAIVHLIECIADAATTSRLSRGTRLKYCGEHYDPTEGLGRTLFRILDEPFAGDFVFFGTGGRFADPSWAANLTLVPGGSPILNDVALSEEMLALMHATALENGAPGLSRELDG
jgi:hypothetical protein